MRWAGFNPEHQYGDVIYFSKDDWPLSRAGLKEAVKHTVLRIVEAVPPEYCDKVKYFVQEPPEEEFYSDKDPLAAEIFNSGFLAWKYPGKL